MPLSIRAKCDACNVDQAEDGVPSIVGERGDVRLTPPRGWFVVATLGPGEASARVQLACSAKCSADLVRATTLEAPLATAGAAFAAAVAALPPPAVRRSGQKNQAPAPTLPTPVVAQVRIVGPFAGNEPAGAIGREFSPETDTKA